MAIEIDISGDGVPKRQLVEGAYGRLGMAGYEFGRTPEETATALRLLDELMAEWPWSNISYKFADYGTGSGEDASGVQLADVAGVKAQLALLLAPEFGVDFSKAASASLSRSVALVHSRYATIPSMPMAQSFYGAGAPTYLRSVDTTPEE